MKTILIDGDVVLYKAAWASNKQEESVAYICVDTIMQGIFDENKDYNDYTLYLKDRDSELKNYREDIDPEYKKNRLKLTPPVHKDIIYDYLVDKWGAALIEGQEVDDELGINQNEDTIIATIDKDLLMIPGRHYHMTKKSIIECTDPGYLIRREHNGKSKIEGSGFKWFCCQVITGDNVDNIPGIKGYGPVKAWKLLKNCRTYTDMWETVEKLYEEKDNTDRLLINAQLLWIRRVPNEVFNPDNYTALDIKEIENKDDK